MRRLVNAPPQSTNGAMMRQPRYNTSIVISNLKCHGAFSPLIFDNSLSVGASLGRSAPPARDDAPVFAVSIARPQLGLLPSGVIADGAKYREHGSHHGTTTCLCDGRRTSTLL